MGKWVFRSFVLFLTAGLFACNRPRETAVYQAFHQENPSYSIISVYAGEGDGAASYFHIKYKKPLDANAHEDVWQYLKTADGKWQVNHKETLH